MPREKPKYAFQIKGRHPGYTDYLVVSSEKGILELSKALERLASLSDGACIDFRIGDRAKFGRDGHISFAKCSDAKLEELVSRTFRSRETGGCLLAIAAIAVFIVGVAHSVQYALSGLAWLVGNV